MGEAGWRIGDRVAGLEITAELGRGGMGVVYRALHPESGTEYAIKTLALEADAQSRARFEREGLSQARVDAHPHIVHVHTAGTYAGRGYLVLELASGGDLKSRLRGGPLDPREAARVGLEIGRALAHAHARGVLHRDLKPANVLFDSDGRAKLVDFGLARLTGERGLTQTGTILGTPAYMSPEQADGENEEIGPRTDVYGLGALVYGALTGRGPCAAEGMAETLNRVFRVRPTPPSQLVTGVPKELDAICLRALEKDPQQRYASAEEMIAALQAFLETTSEEAASRGRVERTLRLASVLAGLALLASAAFAIRTGVEHLRAPPPTPTPRRPTPTPTPARPKDRWALEPGQWLRVHVDIDETNDSYNRTVAKGLLELEVLEATPKGYRVRGCWVLDPSMKSTNTRDEGGLTQFARITYPEEALAHAKDRFDLTFLLARDGRIVEHGDLYGLRHEIMSRVPGGLVEQVGGANYAAENLAHFYDERRLIGNLGFVFRAPAEGSGWTFKEDVAAYRTSATQGRAEALPNWTGEAIPGSAWTYEGAATFEDGFLQSAEVTQTTHMPDRQRDLNLQLKLRVERLPSRSGE